MLKIHKEWRKIMRVAKVKDLRKDIVWLSAKHVHQVFTSLIDCCGGCHDLMVDAD